MSCESQNRVREITIKKVVIMLGCPMVFCFAKGWRELLILRQLGYLFLYLFRYLFALMAFPACSSICIRAASHSRPRRERSHPLRCANALAISQANIDAPLATTTKSENANKPKRPVRKQQKMISNNCHRCVRELSHWLDAN